MTDLSTVTRVEVIEHAARRYVRYGAKVDLSLQDNGRTLKLFVHPREGGEFSKPVNEYVIDVQNRPRMWWPMGNIFRGIKQEWRSISIKDFVENLHKESMRTDLYGYVLMACVSEQVAFLAALYEKHFPDIDVQMALRSLCKNGKMIEMIDPAKGEPLLFAAYNAVMEVRGKM